jgi:hypothetical protein
METLNIVTGKELHWSEWTTNHVEPLYGITNDEFLDIAAQFKFMERSLPHPEAVEFMHRLDEAGLEIVILTARAWHPRAHAITSGWLNMHGLIHHRVEVCGIFDNKADYIRHMDNVLMTIDDSQTHCNRFNAMATNRPEHVFAYGMPWNVNVDPGVIRINSMQDVHNYIEGL